MLMQLNMFAMTVLMGAGLDGIWRDIRANWIGPVFFCAVAVGAFMFLKNQQITKLLVFLAVAAIVGVLIFAGDALFRDGGALTKIFKGTANNLGNQNAGGIGAGGN